MELREPIERINYWLEKEYGKAFNGEPNFRVVFADDQFEKRWTDFNEFGFKLLHPVVKELPKYKQDKDFAGKFILERYIPIVGETDLTTNCSYEPCWVFRDKNGNYVPPFIDGCRFIIDSLFAAIGRSGHAKYTDPNATEEQRLESVKKIENELFGNETSTGDALAHGFGVSMSGTLGNMNLSDIPQSSSDELEKKVN